MSCRADGTFLSYELQLLGMTWRAKRKNRGVTRRDGYRATKINRGLVDRAFTRLTQLALVESRPYQTGLGGAQPLAYYITELGDKTFRHEMEGILGERDWLRFRHRALQEHD